MLSNSYQDRNRIDNAVEYVLEVLLHQKDAIPEDRHPKQDHSFHAKYVDFKLMVPRYHFMDHATSNAEEISLNYPAYPSYQYNFSTEINPPPPKV